MKKFAFLILCLFWLRPLFAFIPPDEGMWLPMFIERLNYTDMQKMGLKLTAEELYSINHSSLKDAIVGLSSEGGSPQGFFCTGEMVSPKGLLFTNHHCGYDAVQQQSSLQNDYLTNGFWATRQEEELVNKGMTASFLIRMEDVTATVLEGISDTTSDQNRSKKIRAAFEKLTKEANEDGKYESVVKSFFSGNEYYLFVYQTFKDVRLVAAPPSSIGKFGGDTDNWMWPRHTGDFCVMRVYCGPDGLPADYSVNNVPLEPKHSLPISLKGIHKDDFAMIWGFPGSTQRYMTSYGVKMATEKTDPALVSSLGTILDVWKKDMDADPATRIKYSSKYFGNSNGWKLYLGEMKQLRHLDVYSEKKKTEDEFTQWVNADPQRKAKFGETLNQIASAYNELENIAPTLYYYSICLARGTEAFSLASEFDALNMALKEGKAVDKETLKAMIEELRLSVKTFYKDYSPATDQKLMETLFRFCNGKIPKNMLPSVYEKINAKYKGDYGAWAKDVFNKSIFTSEEKINKFLKNPKSKTIEKDPIYSMSSEINQNIGEVSRSFGMKQRSIAKNERAFVAGLRQMYPEKKFYPDANSTLRFSYGKVLDYYPADAVHYDYVTTLSGVMQKEDPDNEEFIVPAKLKELYKNKDFGPYGINGDIVTCFLTTNDITGGNSGSPVLNANGELIGLAFDGNWEAMSSNINFEEKLQRTICVDIRYVLFVIDKFAGAKNLMNELTIRN